MKPEADAFVRLFLTFVLSAMLSIPGPLSAQSADESAGQPAQGQKDRSEVNYWTHDGNRQPRKLYHVSSGTGCGDTQYNVNVGYAGAPPVVLYKDGFAQSPVASHPIDSVATEITVTRQTPSEEIYSYTVPHAAYADLNGLREFSIFCPGAGADNAITILIVGEQGNSTYRAYLYFSALDFLGRQIHAGGIPEEDRDNIGTTCFWCEPDAGETENPGP